MILPYFIIAFLARSFIFLFLFCYPLFFGYPVISSILTAFGGTYYPINCGAYLAEEREIHTSVMPMLGKVRMILEILVFSVLQNEDSVWLEEMMLKDFIGDCSQFF